MQQGLATTGACYAAWRNPGTAFLTDVLRTAGILVCFVALACLLFLF